MFLPALQPRVPSWQVLQLALSRLPNMLRGTSRQPETQPPHSPPQRCNEPLVVGHTQQKVPLRPQLELCTHQGALARHGSLLPLHRWPLLLP